MFPSLCLELERFFVSKKRPTSSDTFYLKELEQFFSDQKNVSFVGGEIERASYRQLDLKLQ